MIMALVPSNQFYPTRTVSMDSFQSSMPKLLVTKRLHFLGYGSSIPLKKQLSHVTNSSSMNSDSVPQLNPQKSSNFDGTIKNKRWDFPGVAPLLKSKTSGVRVAGSSWLDKWNETHNKGKLKRPQALLDYGNNGEVSSSDCEENGVGGGGSTMDRIVQKLKIFGYVDDDGEKKENVERVIEKNLIEDILYVEEGILPNARGGLSERSPFGDENVFASNGEVRFPWEKPEAKLEFNSVRQKSRTSFAELTLPEPELRRLRKLALRIKNKMRITGSRVTHEVVERIHEKWKASEVVRVKIEGTPALNMKRMHVILERKTGGLVIWRSGTSVALYRGVEYEAPSERLQKRIYNQNGIPHESSLTSNSDKIPQDCSPGSDVDNPQSEAASISTKNGDNESLAEVNYEDEVDKLLDGLGPRYTDWPGHGPLPVDADLLPGALPCYQPPFRLLPYGVRSTLSVKEGTSLRRLARGLPPHFALGRSRQHQGLAAAMIKLWERCSIVKIALKRGVQLTTSERMAEDIKKLTGGLLLSRNKDFLVFYRGKDFLSPDVAEALLEKEGLAKTLQDEEEQARLRAAAIFTPSMVITDESGTAGTLVETLDADAKWGKKLDADHKEQVMREAEILKHASLVRKLQNKLAFAERKIMKAERALSKVEEYLTPVEHSADPQSITDEERFMFRKLGLKMKALLLLGRRGVFDGTVENMHLHWKYRELIKIIVKAKTFEEGKAIALSLEAESGGVLVSVDKVSKGYAVIVFRGKDYRRPSTLRPKNLLTKRKALARSIELQRREALFKHISTLQTRVEQLRSEIEQMETVKDQGDSELYDRLDSSYPTGDEDSEEEQDDVELEIRGSNIDMPD